MFTALRIIFHRKYIFVVSSVSEGVDTIVNYQFMIYDYGNRISIQREKEKGEPFEIVESDNR